MCESFHSNSPLPPLEHKQTNSNIPMTLNSYITHPIMAGPWVLGTVGMLLRIGRRVSWDPKSFAVILPVIVTAINQKWLLQLFALHKKYIYRFTHCFHFPCLVLFFATRHHHFFFWQGGASSSSSPRLETYKNK